MNWFSWIMAAFGQGPMSEMDIRLIWTLCAVAAALPLVALLVWRCVVGFRQRIADRDKEAALFEARAAKPPVTKTAEDMDLDEKAVADQTQTK